MGSEQAREVLAATWDKRGRLGLGCTIRRGVDSEWSKSDVAIEAMLSFATTAREQALREAAEIAQAKANRMMDLMKEDGKVTEARTAAQAVLEEVSQSILSLLTKEPKA